MLSDTSLWADRNSQSYLGKGSIKSISRYSKGEAIEKCPPPTTKREVTRFLGTVEWLLPRFCKNVLVVVAPLTDLVSPKFKFHWSDCCQKAFDDVKALLTCAPVLAAQRFEESGCQQYGCRCCFCCNRMHLVSSGQSVISHASLISTSWTVQY